MPQTVKRPIENPFRPKEEGLAKSAFDFIFGSNPTEEMQQSLGPTPLISIYKNPAARRLGTQGFLKKAMDMGEKVFDAANQFAARYPRVAAHMNISDDTTKSGIRLLGGTKTRATTLVPGSKVTKPIPVMFNQDFIEDTGENLTGSVFHEGKHVADALGNSNEKELYNLLSSLSEVGYQHNPFEVSARNVATRAATPELAPTKKLARGFMQQVLERGEKYPLPPSHDKFLEEQRALTRIREIMQERGMLRDPNISVIPIKAK